MNLFCLQTWYLREFKKYQQIFLFDTDIKYYLLKHFFPFSESMVREWV